VTITSRTPVADLGVRPHSATCLIQTRYANFPGVVGFGTGFLVGQGRIATAAHVLWNDVDGQAQNKRLPDTVEIYVGKGIFQGFAHLAWTLEPTAAKNPAHPNYLNGDRDSDIAKLQLPDNPTAPLSVLGFPATLTPGEPVKVGGYPTQLTPFGHYEGSGPLVGLTTPVFQHQAPTSHGQSGAPVRVLRDGGWTVVGVHLGEADAGADGATVNRALALTPAIVNWLLK
jgi:V8-like Glu-specific endopeptidase